MLNSTGDTAQLTKKFNTTFTDILDQVAPLKSLRSRNKTHTQPWFNDHTRSIRRQCRIAERKWKKDKLRVSYEMLRDSLKQYQIAVKTAKSNYFSEVIAKKAHRPKVIFKTIDSVLNPTTAGYPTATPEICKKFLEFFVDKIQDSRAQILPSIVSRSESLVLSSSFRHFDPVSLNQLSDIVSSLKQTSSPMDVIRFLKDIFNSIAPIILAIINSSLISGVVPTSFKHAVVQPLLKKPNLDPDILNNYRPISNLSFGKLEKVIYSQLSSYLADCNMLDKFQSGFRAFHSTETALLKVTNDILCSLDSGDGVILILLDLSAAFDTIDHTMLLHRLERVVGIQGVALSWFSSYLKGHTFLVNIGKHNFNTDHMWHSARLHSESSALLFIHASSFRNMRFLITVMQTIHNFIFLSRPAMEIPF